jgi:hypothetical protein
MATHPSLAEALKEADDLDVLIREKLYGIEFEGTARSVWGHSALDISFGHFKSMCFLARNRTDVDSTIRALFRPLLESGYRAAWISLIADDAQIEAMQTIQNWRYFPSVEAIGKSIDARSDDGFTYFETMACTSKLWPFRSYE